MGDIFLFKKNSLYLFFWFGFFLWGNLTEFADKIWQPCPHSLPNFTEAHVGGSERIRTAFPPWGRPPVYPSIRPCIRCTYAANSSLLIETPALRHIDFSFSYVHTSAISIRRKSNGCGYGVHLKSSLTHNNNMYRDVLSKLNERVPEFTLIKKVII